MSEKVEAAKHWIEINKTSRRPTAPEAITLLEGLLSEIQRLTEEVERLKNENINHFNEMFTKNRELMAEITRLKTALSGRTYYHDNAAVEEENKRLASELNEYKIANSFGRQRVEELKSDLRKCHRMYEQAAVRYFELGGDVMDDYNQNITRHEHVDCPEMRDKADSMLWHCEQIVKLTAALQSAQKETARDCIAMLDNVYATYKGFMATGKGMMELTKDAIKSRYGVE